jgi:hypothetical protein
MSIDVKGYDFDGNRPKTDFYKRSKQQSQENIYEFMQNLVMDDITVDGEDVRFRDNTYIYRAGQMYQDYVDFCIGNKYINRLKQAEFKSLLLRCMSESGDKRGRLYKFEQSKIKQFLKFNNYWEEPDLEPEECLIED